MTEFLLELYVARTNCAAVVEGPTRLGCAAAQVTAEGTAVRVVRSIVVPQDETYYVLVEAATADGRRDRSSSRAAGRARRRGDARHRIALTQHAY